jgi:hypothetical protein
MTVHRTLKQRKKLFRAALALDGETMESWCQKRGITYAHLYAVLHGKRESARLMQGIDDYATSRLASQAAGAA